MADFEGEVGCVVFGELRDASAEFMAEGDWEVSVRECVGAFGGVDYHGTADVFVEICAADPAPVHVDCYFVWVWGRWFGDRFDEDGGGGVEAGCFHFVVMGREMEGVVYLVGHEVQRP